MTNSQLLDYVRQRLAQNISREDIKKDLLSGGGWSEADIEHAFVSINKSPVNVWTLLIGAIAYSLISSLAFVFTSGGWSALIFEYIWSIIFGVFCLLVLIISIYRQIKHISKISIRTSSLIFVFSAQFLTLLTNRGDCGDEAGSYSFIDKLIGGDLCNSTSPSIFSNLFFIFALAYIASLIYFLFSIRTSASNAKPKKTPVYVISALFLIVVGVKIFFSMQTAVYTSAGEIQRKNNDLTALAESSRDPQVCEKIEEAVIPDMTDLVSQKDLCYETLAKKLDDLYLCDHIQNTLPYYGTANDCRDYIWYARALAKKDISLCNNIVAEQKQFCLTDDDFIGQSAEQSVGWKTNNIYREAGDKVLSVTYPPAWEVGDFPSNCEDSKAIPSRLLSLGWVTDVSSHEGEMLSFVIDLCVNEENKKAVNFIGFVTTATNQGMGHNVLNIPAGEIEKRKEYSVAQEIITANNATVLPNRTVTVLSPNGLGTLKVGETYNIEWWDNNDAGNRDISVISYLRDEKPVILATNSFVRSSGVDGIYRYSWKIGDTMKGNYRIQVCKSGTKECDLSDAYFTITN